MPTYPTPVHLWRHPKTGYFYLVWQEDGRPVRRSTRTKKRADAELILRDMLRDTVGGWGRPGVTLQLTLHVAAEEWLADRAAPHRRLSPKTLSQYRTFVRQLHGLSPRQLTVSEVGPRDVRVLLTRWEERFALSPEGLRKRLGTLSSMFRWLVRNELARRNPCDAVEPPRARPKHFQPVTPEEYARLQEALREALAGAEDEYWRRGYQALLDYTAVLWLSGMRTIEAIRLRWDDVDLDRMIWVLRSPASKGGTKTLPIHRDLREILLRRRMLGEEGPFVPEKLMRYLWERWKQKRQEFRNLALHGMRARMVTELKRMRELEAAKGLVGHSTDAISDLYTHLGAEDFREALDRIQ